MFCYPLFYYFVHDSAKIYITRQYQFKKNIDCVPPFVFRDSNVYFKQRPEAGPEDQKWRYDKIFNGPRMS